MSKCLIKTFILNLFGFSARFFSCLIFVSDFIQQRDLVAQKWNGGGGGGRLRGSTDGGTIVKKIS